jgi:hypothetical protein
MQSNAVMQNGLSSFFHCSVLMICARAHLPFYLYAKPSHICCAFWFGLSVRCRFALALLPRFERSLITVQQMYGGNVIVWGQVISVSMNICRVLKLCWFAALFDWDLPSCYILSTQSFARRYLTCAFSLRGNTFVLFARMHFWSFESTCLIESFNVKCLQNKQLDHFLNSSKQKSQQSLRVTIAVHILLCWKTVTSWWLECNTQCHIDCLAIANLSSLQQHKLLDETHSHVFFLHFS